jgi:hypothetical protein
MTRAVHILIIMGVVCYFPCRAQEITPEQARTAARNFLQANSNQQPGNVKEIRYTHVKQNSGIPSYYVIQFKNGGFVILSANRNIIPVLGFSESGTFNPGNLPSSLEFWMKSYEEQIIALRKSDYTDEKAEKAWERYLADDRSITSEAVCFEGVGPLLHSTWEQGTYYNAGCPADPAGPGGHAYTGCVATAMAQVMYYYRHPISGNSSVSYYDPDYDTISANFGNTVYRWEEMVPWIMGQANPAIAELMFHCGASIQTHYGASGSGANTFDCASALPGYFNYKPGLAYYYRDSDTIHWKDSLISNLNHGMPVIYRGGPFWSAHCFVCDGYAGSSYFHFNFGWWQGNGNGYYYLDDLSPFHYTFTSGQAGLFNIFPDGDYPHLPDEAMTLTSSRGSLTDGSGPFDYAENMDCSWLIEPEADNNPSIMLYFSTFETEAGKDFLTVYDGEDTNAAIIGQFSGNEIPPSLTSSGSKMLVRFTSDGHEQARGWSAHYSVIEGPYCPAWSVLRDSTGYVYDGSWIIYDYTNNSECYWLIEPEIPYYDSVSGIAIAFSEFNTEKDADYLRIYEGSTVNDRLVAELSGNDIPGNITTNKASTLLRFTSDETITGPGFMASYRCIFPDYCHDTVFLQSSSGTIGDGSGVKYYNHNSDCHWLIAPPGAEYISLQFSSFDLEFGYDWLQVSDASVQPPVELAFLTGDHLPGPYTFKTDRIMLHFHTDQFIKKPGWELTYAADNLGIESDALPGFNIYPNPTSGITTLRYLIRDSGSLGSHQPPKASRWQGTRDRYLISDLYMNDGRKICELVRQEVKPGTCEIQFDFSNLPDGLYLVRMVVGKESAVRKVIVSH